MSEKNECIRNKKVIRYYDGGEPASPFDPRSRSNSPFDGRYATFFRRISGEGSIADLCA